VNEPEDKSPARPAAPAAEVTTRLKREYPAAATELDWRTPLDLLVATMLSAQSTDVRVNGVTRTLFKRYRVALDYAEADPEELEDEIRAVGFFRNKARALRGMGRALVEEHGGEVPRTMEELVRLPGVGRKTANVVLGNAFGVPGITVDTHFGRLVRRFGWTTQTDPDKVERDVAELFPPKDWTQLCHNVIWHGRRRCHQRNPACGACPVARWCPSYGDGETDPVKAAKLVREPRG